jgi:uncharacterized protein YndB with AHSA1/START domain
MALTVRMGIRIRAPREFVFQHLLTPHHLARWFCNFTQFDPKGPAVGSKFRFGGDYAIAAAEPPGWPCEILGGEVLRAVSFAWPLSGADTRVDWRVEDAPDGSALRVTHGNLPGEGTTSGGFHDAWRICLGNLKAVAEARDDSLRPDSSPIPDGRIRLNVLIDAPASRVFAALVEPDVLSKWTELDRPRIEPREGGVYGFGGPFEARGAIAEIESGTRLAVTWPIADRPTQGTFALEEKGGNRTGLYFVHEGVPSDAALRARCRWSDLLVGLKNVLETGETGFTEPYGKQVEGT